MWVRSLGAREGCPMTSSPRRGHKVKRQNTLRCSKWWVIWETTRADWGSAARLVVIILAMQCPADLLAIKLLAGPPLAACASVGVLRAGSCLPPHAYANQPGSGTRLDYMKSLTGTQSRGDAFRTGPQPGAFGRPLALSPPPASSLPPLSVPLFPEGGVSGVLRARSGAAPATPHRSPATGCTPSSRDGQQTQPARYRGGGRIQLAAARSPVKRRMRTCSRGIRPCARAPRTWPGSRSPSR